MGLMELPPSRKQYPLCTNWSSVLVDGVGSVELDFFIEAWQMGPAGIVVQQPRNDGFVLGGSLLFHFTFQPKHTLNTKNRELSERVVLENDCYSTGSMRMRTERINNYLKVLSNFMCLVAVRPTRKTWRVP